MKPLVIDGPRMSDIGEWGEASYLKELVDKCLEEGRRILGVHLWTHSPRAFATNPLLMSAIQRLRERSVPLAVQVTITGLGGTVLEPGIETTDQAFAHLRWLVDTGLLSSSRLCVRVDPIQRWQGPFRVVTNLDTLDRVLQHSQEMDVQRIRVSLLSYHRYHTKITPRECERGLKALGLDPEDVGAVLRKWIRKGMDVRSCATDLTGQGIPPGPCFDFLWVTGHPREGPVRPVAPRTGCLCFYPEYVRLLKIPRRSSCKGRCMACYAQDHI